MTKIALYSNQPFLVTGLQTILAGQEDLQIIANCSTPESFVERIQAEPVDVLLIELMPETTAKFLERAKKAAATAALVLWAEAISAEFAATVIELGVRGILRKSLPIELHIKCLRKVAQGELWLEKSLTDQLLGAPRMTLSRREWQLAGLLAQGLKNKEIAYSLGITQGTTKVYLSRLFAKVGVGDRFEMALFALKNQAQILAAGTAQPAASTHAASISTVQRLNLLAAPVKGLAA